MQVCVSMLSGSKTLRVGMYLNTYIILIGYVDREHYCFMCFGFFLIAPVEMQGVTYRYRELPGL